MFDILEADIVVMQEAKIQRKDLTDDMVLVNGWDVTFSLPRDKKGKLSSFPRDPACVIITDIPLGYSGVAIYTRNSKCCPIRAEEGLTGVLCPPKSSTRIRDLPADQQIGGYPREEQLLGPIDESVLDSEGRCVILEFPAFVLIGVYVPATRDDTRTDFRMGFLSALDARIRNLVAIGKQVVLAGDLNIIRTDIDTAGCSEQLRKEGMTLDDFLSMPSRRFFNQLIFEGQVIGERDEGRKDPVMWDITRTFHPNRQGMFTCWETKKNARPGNFGSRIDYILCTDGIKNWFEDSNIQEGLLGSDHCPVYTTLADVVKHDGVDIHIADLMNPEGMFKHGKRLREWNAKDLLPQSAKLLTEFDRRRSIKDMFVKKLVTPKMKQTSTDTTGSKHLPSTLNISDMQASIIDSSLPPSATPAATKSTSDASHGSPLKTTSPTTVSKRPSSSTSAQQSKKVKAISAKDKGKPGPMQSSLKGFFKPKAPLPNTTEENTQEGESSKMVSGGEEIKSSSSQFKKPVVGSSQLDDAANISDDEVGTIAQDRSDVDEAGGEEGEKVFDPIESKESWSKLLGKKRAAPLCEHGEDCVSYVTKKPGVNKGKSSLQWRQYSNLDTLAAYHERRRLFLIEKRQTCKH